MYNIMPNNLSVASIIKRLDPSRDWRSLITYPKNILDIILEELLQKKAAESSTTRVTIMYDIIHLKEIKEKGNWRYGESYKPRGNNYSRITAIYKGAKLLPGYKTVINSFPRRFPNRVAIIDFPPKKKFRDSKLHYYYATYSEDIFVDTFQNVQFTDSSVHKIIHDHIRQTTQSEESEFQVLSYLLRTDNDLGAVSPNEMLMGHSELQNEHGNQSEILKCVPNAHLSHIQLKRQNIDENKWIEIFGQLEGLYNVDELIEKLYSNYDISVVLYDSIGNIIYKKKSNKLRLLVCEVTSGHMYGDLPDGPQRVDILKRAFTKSHIKLETEKGLYECKLCEFKTTEKTISMLHKFHNHDWRNLATVKPEELNSFLERKDSILVTTEINNSIVGDIISKLKIKPFINKSNGKISHLRIASRKLDILLSTEDEQLTNLGNHFSIKYQGETMSVLLRKIWDKHINNYKSTFNSTTDEFFRQERFPVDCRIQINEHDDKPIYQIDTKNAYLMVLAYYNLPVYTALDLPEDFSPETVSDITTGWYKIVIDEPIDEFINETGWYNDILVRSYLKQKLLDCKQIKRRFLPTYTIEREKVRTLINEVIKSGEDNLKELNKLVGYFRLFTTKNETTNISNDTSEVEYFYKRGAQISPIYNSEKEFTDYYMLVGKQEQNKHQIASPIYFYVVQTLYSMLLDMKLQLQSQNCNVIGYCTDAVYFQLPEGKIIEEIKTPINRHIRTIDQIAIGEHYIGKYKEPFECKIGTFSKVSNRCFPDCFKENKYTIKKYKYSKPININNFYNKYITEYNGSFLLSGLPGSGKTYLIRETCKKFDEQNIKYKILAFSNCAVSLYDVANTFHREFHLSTEESTVSSRLIDRISEYEFIIIDEYSMISDTIWSYISLLKKYVKSRFILVGDHRQLPPIFSEENNQLANKPNIFNNSVIREIHDYTIIELNYSRRIADKNFLEYLRDNETYSIDKLHKLGVKKTKKYSKYNIVVYNNTRIKINHELRLKKCNCIDYKCKPEFQIGEQVICIENNKNLKLVKNKHYIVKEIDEYITLSPDNNIHDSSEEIKIPLSESKLLDYGYAFTIWKTQGCTINTPITICNYRSLNMDLDNCNEFLNRDMQKRIIYTAMSRVSTPKQISIIN